MPFFVDVVVVVVVAAAAAAAAAALIIAGVANGFLQNLNDFVQIAELEQLFVIMFFPTGVRPRPDLLQGVRLRQKRRRPRRGGGGGVPQEGRRLHHHLHPQQVLQVQGRPPGGIPGGGGPEGGAGRGLAPVMLHLLHLRRTAGEGTKAQTC